MMMGVYSFWGVVINVSCRDRDRSKWGACTRIKRKYRIEQSKTTMIYFVVMLCWCMVSFSFPFPDVVAICRRLARSSLAWLVLCYWLRVLCRCCW